MLIAVVYDGRARCQPEDFSACEDVQIAHRVLVRFACLVTVPATAKWRVPLGVPRAVVERELLGWAIVVRVSAHRLEVELLDSERVVAEHACLFVAETDA